MKIHSLLAVATLLGSALATPHQGPKKTTTSSKATSTTIAAYSASTTLTRSPSTSAIVPSSTTAAATVTNPWGSQCPVPSNFIINSFASTVSASGHVSLKLTYGNGTFTCPDSATHEIMYNGYFDMNCDPDGLARVLTDGFSWIWIQEWFWCTAVPQPRLSYSTLQTFSNYTGLGAALTCKTVNGVKTCTQKNANFVIPVQSYGTGGIIGFEPINTDGVYLPQCTSLLETNPVITNTATCT